VSALGTRTGNPARDDELNFHGPATSDVLEAWQHRLERMAGLRHFLGPPLDEFRHDFLVALTSLGHRSSDRVVIGGAENGGGRPMSTAPAPT
jgi:hypothetical protein